MMEISEELSSDMAEVEELLDLTFGPGRNALSSYRFREGVKPVPELCFVMRDEYNILVGVIRFWPILIGWPRVSGLLLGPLGVHPTRQGEGLGELLINSALKKAKNLGWRRVLLVGDLAYYERFGFVQHLTTNIYLGDKSSGDRLLGHELIENSLLNLSGPVFHYFE